MRFSRLLLRTLRDAPADAEAVSHQLLVRGGYIRRHASGIYTWLPLGRRLLRQVETLIREEMDRAGAQELLLPVLQSVEPWEATGRLSTMEDILFRLEGRGGDFVLGPTHEEIVTTLVAGEVESYRDLPVNLYQIQLKYRDEARPRFGLLRGREFVMKDAYSFDASPAGMQESYRLMYDAYERIFERCELAVLPVEADAGAIGGEINHEWMVDSPIGEDLIVRCPKGDYSANAEAAIAGARWFDRAPVPEPLVSHHTPDRPGIDLVVEHFRAAGRDLAAAGMLKCIALLDESSTSAEPVVALVPGDREVRVPKGHRPFDDADFARFPFLHKGYIGPMGLQAHGVRVIADPLVKAPVAWVTGANEPDHHVTGAMLGRDFTVDAWQPVATVVAGDPCPRCGTALEIGRAVEAGHTFQLGLTYSLKIPGATFLDEDGNEQPFWMGCYGIGVSRLPAIIAETHHDGAGLVWPKAVAPFEVHLLSLAAGRSPEVTAAADDLYASLVAAGVSVLYDDRPDASPGVKFADADLLGMPMQLVVGAKGLARGVVERKDRATGERDELPLVDAVVSLAP
ncbi:MAG TPA: proline--tRNA ligase [Acidimicrobiales bacterium]|jgi:prolyl-tRNA synthetase|nr:proline--tRNA ligase [Acidimicrobiales bacterium]